jgi:hypothetical protein
MSSCSSREKFAMKHAATMIEAAFPSVNKDDKVERDHKVIDKVMNAL